MVKTTRMTETDHDLLIKIHTDVKYIKRDVKTGEKTRKFLLKENQDRKDWQESSDLKVKIYLTIASFIGGIVVFLVDKMYELYLRRVS